MAKVTQKLSRGHARLNQAPEERLPLGVAKIPMWDQLIEHKDGFIGGCHAMFVQIAAALDFISKDQTAYSFVKDKQRFLDLINSAKKDYDDNLKAIADIFEQHKNKKGYTLNADDHMLCLHLNGMYTEQFAKFQLAADPTIRELGEIISQAAIDNENHLTQLALQKKTEEVAVVSAEVVQAE